MAQSDSIKELAVALAKAQSELPKLVKDSTGQVGQQKTHYASLDAVVDAMRGPFNSNGLAFTQSPIVAGPGMVGLRTRLLHSSGEWLEDVFELPVQPTAQGYGSGLTYARRYALQALAGLAPEDDDGAGAMPAAPARRPEPRVQNIKGENTATAKEPMPWMKQAQKALAERGLKFRDIPSVVPEGVDPVMALTAWSMGKSREADLVAELLKLVPENEAVA